MTICSKESHTSKAASVNKTTLSLFAVLTDSYQNSIEILKSQLIY